MAKKKKVSKCYSCGRANVDCPVYPLETQTCVEWISKKTYGRNYDKRTTG